MNIYCHFKFHDWSWVSLEHGLHQKFNFLLLILHSCWERWPSTPLPTFKFFSRYEWGVYGIRCVSLLCALSTPQTILGTKLDCIRNFLIHLSTMNCRYYQFKFWKQSRVPLDQWLDQSFFLSFVAKQRCWQRWPSKPLPTLTNWNWVNEEFMVKICGPIMGASNSTSNLGPLDLIGSEIVSFNQHCEDCCYNFGIKVESH